MNESQIKIGASSWGSKIDINDSIRLGEKIIDIGLNHFDTAPNYGSGYSHYILNEIGKKKDVLVDTKYGQNIELSIKEFVKRIYRFKNLKSFKQSFQNIKSNICERNNKKFWHINKIEKAFYSFKNELNNCNINSFYLHSPPFGILDIKYLNEFSSSIREKQIVPGISDPDSRDLILIIENFPEIDLQLSLNTFLTNKDFLINKGKNININSIFKNLKNPNIVNYNLYKEFLDILKQNNNYNIVLGVNSLNSFKKLKNIITDFSNIL